MKAILLVDDDDNIRQNYHDILEDEGYLVYSFGDVNRALHQLSETSIQLAILDISLYGDRKAGHRLCAKIVEKYPEVKVAMLTSFDSDEDRAEARVNGASYWIKSADMLEINTSVSELLNHGA